MSVLNELKEKIQSQPFFSSPLYLKYQHLVVPGIILVVAIVISGLVTIPQFFKLFETFKNIDALSEQRNFFTQKTATLEGIDVDLYRRNLDTALIALPVDKDVPGVTGELLTSLSGSGMTLEAITFSGSDAASDKVSEYTLRMEVAGNEENLKNFMDRIRSSPRIVKLTAIEVTKDKTAKINASISFVTLFQPLPQSIGTVEEKVPEITTKDTQVLADIKAKEDALPKITSADGATAVPGKLNPFAE